MARFSRKSRFHRSTEIGEDVNPSAYIVNLADCMLVLACGFMVAMMARWNITLNDVEELDQSKLEQIDTEATLSAEELQSGSYYSDIGSVYQDPNTGELYIVKDNKKASSSKSGKESSSKSSKSSKSSDSKSRTSSKSSSKDNDSANNSDATAARAQGAD